MSNIDLFKPQGLREGEKGITDQLNDLSSHITNMNEGINKMATPALKEARKFLDENKTIVSLFGIVPDWSKRIDDFIKWTDGILKPIEVHKDTEKKQIVSVDAKNKIDDPKNAPAEYTGDIHLDPVKLQISPESVNRWSEIEFGLNRVAKDLNINAYALFSVILSESHFNIGAVEKSGGGGRGLLQFTGDTQKLLNGDWSLQSQLNAVKKYFSQNPANLKKMQNAKDLKLLTRWGMYSDASRLAQARASKAPEDTTNFNDCWKAIQDAVA